MTATFKRLALAVLLPVLAALACELQPGTPAVGTNVETVVAQTMQALTPHPVASESAPALPAGGSLPHSLYFLNSDSAGFLQVYRLEKDGKTVQQVTFEPSNVETYDVSPKDGSVAYTSNNQLLLVGADGSGRRVLVDGGPLGSDESYITHRVGRVAWSPDGETVAFGYGGLNFYAIDSGAVNNVLENMIDASPGISILREGYAPMAYAPDGRKLLIAIGYYEGGVYAVYHLDGNILARSQEDPVSCCEGSWAPDGSAYYAASPYFGMITPGMWRLNADGTVVVLIDNDLISGDQVHYAQAPLLAPDGRLYYFYNTLPAEGEFVNRVPLYMVRSDPDGVTGRINLVATPFEGVNEILWAPDASFAILAIAPLPDVYQGGKAEVVYTDGRPGGTLVPFARDMRWGP